MSHHHLYIEFLFCLLNYWPTQFLTLKAILSAEFHLWAYANLKKRQRLTHFYLFSNDWFLLLFLAQIFFSNLPKMVEKLALSFWTFPPRTVHSFQLLRRRLRRENFGRHNESVQDMALVTSELVESLLQMPTVNVSK